MSLHRITLLLCGLALLGGTTNADAAIRNWKAFTVDNLWSNPANWEEGVAPVDGDDLRFPVPGGGGPVTVVNDIANLRVHTLVTMGTPHKGIDLGRIPDVLENFLTTRLNPFDANIFQAGLGKRSAGPRETLGIPAVERHEGRSA